MAWLFLVSPIHMWGLRANAVDFVLIYQVAIF